MHEKSIRLFAVVAFLSLCLTPFSVLAEEHADPYEQIYWADDELPNFNHHISLGGGLDTGNPLLDIYNLQLGYAYSLNALFELGFVAKTFITQKTGLKDRVDQEFDLIGLQSEGVEPSWASYFVVSLIPFQGRVNLLGYKNLPFAFLASVGPGLRTARDKQKLYGWQWSLTNRLYLKERLSLEFNFTQELEAAFSSQQNTTRNQLNVVVGCFF